MQAARTQCNINFLSFHLIIIYIHSRDIPCESWKFFLYRDGNIDFSVLHMHIDKIYASREIRE
jgi:hypothetical protein